MVGSQEPDPRPPALQLCALPTELMLPWLSNGANKVQCTSVLVSCTCGRFSFSCRSSVRMTSSITCLSFSTFTTLTCKNVLCYFRTDKRIQSFARIRPYTLVVERYLTAIVYFRKSVHLNNENRKKENDSRKIKNRTFKF